MADDPKPHTEPTPATKIVQDALRLYCETDLLEFEARVDGMLIRVTREGWIVCPEPKAC
jgi:hypothetical protein